MDPLTLLLWVVFPYITMAVFVVGLIWRYRYDKFGWTSRSSESYENRLLRWGGPLFHYGIFFVFAGHVLGLLIPKEWISALGVSEHVYHLVAVTAGTIAAVMTIGGLAILIYRRRTVGAVFLATTRMDKLMYLFLSATLLLGAASTVVYQIFGPGFEYRTSVSPWVRSILFFQPQPELMTGVPVLFQAHILMATALFLLWPFTRLVHVFSAPVWYLFRPYVVYRARSSTSPPRSVERGWEPVAPPDPERLRRP